MKRCLYFILLALLFAGFPANSKCYYGLDKDNPVAFLGNSIKYKGKTIRLDAHNIYVDGNLPDEMVRKHRHVYKTFREAAANLLDGTEDCPMRVYMAPYVYWADNPDNPAVAVGICGREPFGMVIKCEHLHLIGLTDNPEYVVIASKRGQTQGAVGNFTMLDFWGNGLQVSNMTLGNYCNVDMDYRLLPQLSIRKRSEAITQAHVAYCHGDRVVARNVHFISRLNMNPLNGARRIFFYNCHMECTDDALTGNGVYMGCTFGFYGQKPFYTTHACGAVFLDCDFYMRAHNAVMAFCKAGGPLTVVNCRYHAADSTYITWTNYPEDRLRCYQAGFTLNGHSYTIGHRKVQNTVELTGMPALDAFVVEKDGKTLYNVANLLHGDDGWDPMKSEIFAGDAPPVASKVQQPSVLLTNRNRVELVTGGGAAVLSAVPMRHCGYVWRGDKKTVRWRVPAEYSHCVRLSAAVGDSITVKSVNESDETAFFCIEAYTDEGLRAAVEVVARPALLPQPQFVVQPRIVVDDSRKMLSLDYSLELGGRRDMSEITWYRATRSDGTDSIPIRVSRYGVPETEYPLTAADSGCWIFARIEPRHIRSRVGEGGCRVAAVYVDGIDIGSGQTAIDTDFSTFPTCWQAEVKPGYWTVDGYKPADTAEFDWTFDSKKDMWTYGEGFNGAVGRGLLQAQRGARLMYQPVGAGSRDFGDMRLVLDVDPTKTAGQGFGSATGQYMDVCLKFEPHTLSGYALRIIRTVKHAKAVDFLLVRYDGGRVTPLTAPVSAVCYRTGCRIVLAIEGTRFTAGVTTSALLPEDSSLAKEVHLAADIESNPYGGLAIQHTGSCGESTTMLHRLRVEWSIEKTG